MEMVEDVVLEAYVETVAASSDGAFPVIVIVVVVDEALDSIASVLNVLLETFRSSRTDMADASLGNDGISMDL